MQLRRVLIYTMVGGIALLSMWGCGSKEPTEAQKKQELVGQPGKKFDPSSVPPQYKEGFEKMAKGQRFQGKRPGHGYRSTKTVRNIHRNGIGFVA